VSAVGPVPQGTGVASSRARPSRVCARAWDSIILPEGEKLRLARHAVPTLRFRADRIPFESLPLHGITGLVVPPGRGKTTFARGHAERVAAAPNSLGAFVLIEVDPRSLRSSAHSRTQRHSSGELALVQCRSERAVVK
jgi:hypothetical protein